MKTVAALGLLLMLPLSACSPDNRVDPVSAQSSIIYSETPIPLADEAIVECDGPADELALLGSLCGASTQNLRAEGIRDVEWGNRISLDSFYLYAMGSADDLPNLVYAAGVSTADGDEAVVEGMVNPTFATPNACSTTFAATAEFLWRNTTIRMNLSASIPC